MQITKQEAAKMLLNMDNILILTHANPDGDAVGSACGLCHALRLSGKTAYIKLDVYAKNFAPYPQGLTTDSFQPDFVVSVDTAEKKMLSSENTALPNDFKIHLAIDHHKSNTFYAMNTYLDASAASASEAVADIVREMNIPFTKEFAECIYLGLSTDTGCFRYSNTTSKTLRLAADLADLGVDIATVNKIQFETKTRGYAELEKAVISSMQILLDGKLAIIAVTNELFEKFGVKENEIQALSALPRQIEDVLIGITLKEKQKGIFKLSIRTNDPIDASKFAANFGGGGHKNAAGGEFEGTLIEAIADITQKTKKMLEDLGL